MADTVHGDELLMKLYRTWSQLKSNSKTNVELAELFHIVITAHMLAQTTNKLIYYKQYCSNRQGFSRIFLT